MHDRARAQSDAAGGGMPVNDFGGVTRRPSDWPARGLRTVSALIGRYRDLPQCGLAARPGSGLGKADGPTGLCFEYLSPGEIKYYKLI